MNKNYFTYEIKEQNFSIDKYTILLNQEEIVLGELLKKVSYGLFIEFEHNRCLLLSMFAFLYYKQLKIKYLGEDYNCFF